jgi:hypothetical protein
MSYAGSLLKNILEDSEMRSMRVKRSRIRSLYCMLDQQKILYVQLSCLCSQHRLHIFFPDSSMHLALSLMRLPHTQHLVSIQAIVKSPLYWDRFLYRTFKKNHRLFD